MSANFHNKAGMHLNGLDLHTYHAATPNPFEDLKIPCHPHASGVFYFWWLTATHHKAAVNTTAEGWAMLQQGYDFYIIAHCFVPLPPPGTSAISQLMKIIYLSGSKLWMGSYSVTSGGNPLAICQRNLFSFNLNCSDPTDLPINAVINLNSVQTMPTMSDLAASASAAAVDALVTFLVGKGLEKSLGEDKLRTDLAKQLWRRAPDVISEIEDNTTKPVSKFVKQAVDGAR